VTRFYGPVCTLAVNTTCSNHTTHRLYNGSEKILMTKLNHHSSSGEL